MKVFHARSWTVGLVSVALVGLWVAGCGPGGLAVGEVEGTVTLDGSPLPDATISFYPEGGGRTASAITDSAGHYRLEYTADEAGAIVGKHKVSITTFQEGEVDDQGKVVREPVPEKVPAKYNKETTLVQEVKSGSQTIDFKLESK